MSSYKGTQGEQIFSDIMSRQGYVVENVVDDPIYQRQDIDFIITSPTTHQTKTFEVKYDYCVNKTGNLYLEIINAHSEGGCGWWEFCKADYLAYGDAHSRTFYIFSLLELRERVETLPKRYGQCKQDSVGLLVPLSAVKDLYKTL